MLQYQQAATICQRLGDLAGEGRSQSNLASTLIALKRYAEARRALERAVLQVAPEARGRLYVVSGRARQYITSLRVLSEGESGGQLQVRISAQVDVPRLLREIPRSMTRLRAHLTRLAGSARRGT